MFVWLQMNTDGKNQNQREAFQLLLKQHMVTIDTESL